MSEIAIQSGAIVYPPGTSDAEIEAAARHAAIAYRRKVVFWRLAILAGMLAFWEVAARTGVIDSFFYSYPSAIAVRLWELVTEGTDEASLWYHLWITMEEAMIGFLFGSVFGVAFGVALGRNRMASDIFSVYIKVLNAIPRVVLAPIFILLFGFGLWSKVALSFVMVFFVVFSNAFQGVREADRAMIANAQILGASQVGRHPLGDRALGHELDFRQPAHQLRLRHRRRHRGRVHRRALRHRLHHPDRARRA